MMPNERLVSLLHSLFFGTDGGIWELREFWESRLGFPWDPFRFGNYEELMWASQELTARGLDHRWLLYAKLIEAFPAREAEIRAAAREIGVEEPRPEAVPSHGKRSDPDPAPVPPPPARGGLRLPVRANRFYPTSGGRSVARDSPQSLAHRLSPGDVAAQGLGLNATPPGIVGAALDAARRFLTEEGPESGETAPDHDAAGEEDLSGDISFGLPPVSRERPQPGELHEAMEESQPEGVAEALPAAGPAPIGAAAPPPRTLNAALFDRDRLHPPSEPLALGGTTTLRVAVGPVAAWTAVAAPQLLPGDVSAAIEAAGGEQVQLVFQSPDFWLEGADAPPPVPTRPWQSTERALFVPARGSSDPVEIAVSPLHAGLCYLRCTVYFRNALVQSLRLDARVLDAQGDAPVDTIPEAARPSVVQRLNGLGYEVVTEYTAAPGLVALGDVPPRAVSLYTNETWGTHALGVRVEGSDPVTRTVTLRPDQMGPRADVARATLVAIGTRVDGDRKSYRFSADAASGKPANAGTPEDLRAALGKLARLGYQLYAELLPTDLRTALVPALRLPTTISVARLAEGEVLPWALLYDRPLDLDDASPEEVCLRLQEAPPDQPPDAVACRKRADCPLQDEARKRRVVCPWGFWGIKHAIEQPPQRLDPGQEGRPLVTRIEGPVRLDMNVFPSFSRLANHRPLVKALSDAFVYAGDDTAPGAPPALPGVRSALRDRELTAIYFYCHGGEIKKDGLPVPFLAVGKSKEQLLPIDLREVDPDTGSPVYAWPRHPLVFLNGCETAMLEPRILAHFVDAFAERGAAGVIGTEVPVFEALATEVAEVFLRLFLREGRTVGEALRQVRHDLLRRNNPLGLVYTAYASADLKWAKGD